MKVVIDGRMILDRPTGIGRYTYNLIRYLGNIDSHNEYVIFTNDESILKNLKNERIHIKEIRQRPFSLTEHIGLAGIIRKEKADIFHAPSFNVPLRIPCPYIITLHDLTHIRFAKDFGAKVNLFYSFVVKPSAKSAARIITDSVKSKEDSIVWLRECEEKLRVIMLAPETAYRVLNDCDAISKIRKRFNVRGRLIVYNGSKKPHKNVLSLIKAFQHLVISNGIEATLAIVGKNDPAVPETDHIILEKAAQEKQMKNGRIVFTGYLSDDDLCILYNAADLFVFPSLYEGFGLPPLEAMSCGCPVVAANTSSLPEVCGNGAYYVKPDPKSIAKGMHTVLCNEEMRNTMKINALHRAGTFSWEKCARETLQVYEEVHNETRNRS